MSNFHVWKTLKPFTLSLPLVYQENAISSWLSNHWDNFLLELKSNIALIASKQLDPELCDENWLEFLAILSGFTGEYWDNTWDIQIRRQLVKRGLSKYWKLRGTKEVLTDVLSLFLGQDFDIKQASFFILNVSRLGSRLGKPTFIYYVRLPIKFDRRGFQFKVAEKINRLYGAFYCDSRVTYDAFYLGFSRLGDPLFDEGNQIHYT